MLVNATNYVINKAEQTPLASKNKINFPSSFVILWKLFDGKLIA